MTTPSTRILTLPGLIPVCLKQERLLLFREGTELYSQHPAPAFLIPLGIRLEGQLNVRALTHALSTIARRHGALRASFFKNPHVSQSARMSALRRFARTGVCEPGLYCQSIGTDDIEVELRQIDISDAAAKQPQIATICQEEHQRCFDYAKPPFLRGTLITLEPRLHLLLIVADHIVADAWSMAIIRKELYALYIHFTAAGSDVPAMPSFSYPDYAAWQREMLDTSHFDSALAYWRAQWTEFASARIGHDQLPFAGTPTAIPKVSSTAEGATLDGIMCGKVRVAARTFQVTLYILFMTVYAILWHCYTQNERVALWGHFANRVHPETDRTVGFFVNTHLLGIDISNDPTGVDLLNQVRTTLLDVYLHQHMPLEVLWWKLQCIPRYPDAKVLLDYVVLDQTPTHTSDLIFSNASLPDSGSPRQSEIALHIIDAGQNILLSARYAPDRLLQAGVLKLLEHYQQLLKLFLDDPNARLSRFRKQIRQSGSNARFFDQMNEFIVLRSDFIPNVPVEKTE